MGWQRFTLAKKVILCRKQQNNQRNLSSYHLCTQAPGSFRKAQGSNMAKWRWGKGDRRGHDVFSEEGRVLLLPSTLTSGAWGISAVLLGPTGAATLAPTFQFPFSCKTSSSQHFTKALEMSKMLFFFKSMKIISQ